MRKTKIVCTIGPACDSEEMLRAMMLAGMNVARLNFSHGTHAEHQVRIDRIKKLRTELGLPIAIMLDTKGPEYRIGTFEGGKITLDGKDITRESIRQRSKDGMSHIPEDRHKHGLVLDYSLENNMVLQRYWQPEFQKGGFIQSDKVREYSDKLIAQYDVRSGQGSSTIVRSMSGGNQQKAIIAREIDKDPKLLVAVQPTRGLDVGAIEYIHRQIVAERDKGKAVLLVSLELDEVMNLSDRILVMYEGEIVGEFDPKTTTVQELGLYMAGARKQGKESK